MKTETNNFKAFEVFKNDRDSFSIIHMDSFRELKQEFKLKSDAENFIKNNIFFSNEFNEYRYR